MLIRIKIRICFSQEAGILLVSYKTVTKILPSPHSLVFLKWTPSLSLRLSDLGRRSSIGDCICFALENSRLSATPIARSISLTSSANRLILNALIHSVLEFVLPWGANIQMRSLSRSLLMSSIQSLMALAAIWST